MWIVIKYDQKYLSLLKRELSKKIGKDIEFYIPKIRVNNFKKNKIHSQEKLLLGDYLLCSHENFKNINFINVMKYSRGLKNIFYDFFNAQKEIISFVEKCKLYENENGYIKQNFFNCCQKKNYEFISGPFSKMIFKIIEENKFNYKLLLDNFKITISKEEHLFKPV